MPADDNPATGKLPSQWLCRPGAGFGPPPILDALGVTTQLPGALDGRASAEALDLVRVNAAQQIRRQREPAQQLELVDLGQQALQSDPPGIGDETGKCRTLAVVGQQSVQTPSRAGVEATGHAPQRCVVVRGAGGAQDAVETVRAGSGNPPARARSRPAPRCSTCTSAGLPS